MDVDLEIKFAEKRKSIIFEIISKPEKSLTLKFTWIFKVNGIIFSKIIYFVFKVKNKK